MPTDRRTSAGSTSSGEPAADACVMRAGCSMRDSTAPSDSASVNTFVRRDDVERGGLAAAHRERHHPAEVTHLALRDVVAGMVGEARPQHTVDRGMRDEHLGDRARVVAMAVHADGERLHAAQHEIAVERRRHRAGRVLHERDAVGELVVRCRDEAADHVGVATEVLRRRVHDGVGAERQRLLQVRRGERVVDDDTGAATRARRRATASMSTIVEHRIGRRLDPHERGAVGPFTSPAASDVGEVGRRPRPSGRPVDLVDEPERPAVRVVAEHDVRARAAAGAAARPPRRDRWRTRSRASRLRATRGTSRARARVGLPEREYS